MTTTDVWVAWTTDPVEPRIVRATRYGHVETEVVGMFDTSELAREAVACRNDVQHLAEFIMRTFPNEPSTSDGAVAVAIRLLAGQEFAPRVSWWRRLLWTDSHD